MLLYLSARMLGMMSVLRRGVRWRHVGPKIVGRCDELRKMRARKTREDQEARSRLALDELLWLFVVLLSSQLVERFRRPFTFAVHFLK
jgi:hypothetical protein